MDEVAELIRRLDTTTSAAVNEVRIIQLEHSLAQDVAMVLQSAIGARRAACRACRRMGGQPPGMGGQPPGMGGQPPGMGGQPAGAGGSARRGQAPAAPPASASPCSAS